jgi:hypothetical protein
MKLDQFAGSSMERNKKKYQSLGFPLARYAGGRSYDAADVLARAASS